MSKDNSEAAGAGRGEAKPWSAMNVQQGINSLLRKAKPADGSAPIEPVVDLGSFVMNHWVLINRALIHYWRYQKG